MKVVQTEKRRKTIKMRKILTILLITIFVISSIGCITEEQDKETQVQSPGSKQIGTITSVPTDIQVKTKTSENIVKLQLENYDGGSFKMKKPVGWEVIQAGSCETFALLVRDRNAPENQIFYFNMFGPYYTSQRQKANDEQYMREGGYQVIWIEMPVVDPLTPENFITQFHLAAKTNLVKNFMGQMPELEKVEVISSTPEKSIIGDTKLVRALFTQNGKLGEGLFYMSVDRFEESMSDLANTYFFSGTSASKDRFIFVQDQLLESIKSIEISPSYVSGCLAKPSPWVDVSKTISETSDIMTSGWDERQKTDDIISAKRSDAIMGRDRVYDEDTGNVYEVNPNFYDKYDINRGKYKLNNLQRLPGENHDLWTSPTLNGNQIQQN
jgi:hypothetical protein